ncbi:TolC family protein [Candidatus Protochlamydia phocaeensis]|uniref:TolC family protein n=1 Tax=Candidatus Protochlamydia phocaeensis TaxID=1414722 RepID=UPI000838F802|nr:TolC family protein [Candidatus Protochlamydia phocaeensis]
MNKWQKLSAAVLLAALLSNCTRLPQQNEEYVSGLVQDRIAKNTCWQKACHQDPAIAEFIQNAVSQTLSVDQAVQVALLNNPRLQEAFEEIGIAQADLIEAGLLSNPVFEGFMRYPDAKRAKIDAEISVMQNFLDVFLIPLKRRLASAELQQTLYETSSKILDLSFEVEETYYALVAAYQRRDLLKMMIELADIANQIALAQIQVGTIYKLDLQLRTAQYLEKTVELADAERALIQLKEKLNSLMGLASGKVCWTVENELPYIPSSEPNLDCLESIAFYERLDIQAARWNVERLARFFPTVQWWTFTGLQAGFSSERDADGIRVTGPQFSASLPLFNFGQADRHRLFAQFRQAVDRLAALEIDTYAQVREARELLLVSRNQVSLYAGKILPNQAQIVHSTEELYNVMGVGVFELLDNKRNQLQAYLNYLLALRDYWIARVKLDKAIGGKLYLIGPAYQNDCCEEGGKEE